MGYKKAIESNTFLEIYEYEKDYVYSGKRNYRKNKRKGKKGDDPRSFVKYRRIRSIQRARQSFFRLVEANLQKDSFPALATFTCFEEHTLPQAYAALTNFFKNIREVAPLLSYIAVPEWQKRGTIHFHALVWGIDPKTIFDEVPWHYRAITNRKRYDAFIQFCLLHGFKPENTRGTRYFQRSWGRGFFDIIGTTNNSRALAAYMAKYLVKGLADPRLSNNRAYSSSHNVLRPWTIGTNDDDEFSYMIQNKDMSVDFQKVYDTLYLGRCVYKKINYI